MKKWVLDFIDDISRRASSRKFLVLMLAMFLHLKNPQGFSGENMVWVFAVYMGANVIEKFVGGKGGGNENNNN